MLMMPRVRFHAGEIFWLSSENTANFEFFFETLNFEIMGMLAE